MPVAAADSLAALERVADEVVAAQAPVPFEAVGRHYRDFSPVGDTEVAEVLGAS